MPNPDISVIPYQDPGGGEVPGLARFQVDARIQVELRIQVEAINQIEERM